MDSRNAQPLYLVVSLKRPNGDVIEATSCKVGFRTVEIKDKQLLVNGQPILVKGVNYHEHNENTGHYVSEELMKKDFELWKRYNVNTVRTCHYPSRNVSTNSVTNMVSTSSTKPI